MSTNEVKPVNEEDLKDLKSRMKMISDADPAQYHNEFSLRRYLRAFKDVDKAFQVSSHFYWYHNSVIFYTLKIRKTFIRLLTYGYL